MWALKTASETFIQSVRWSTRVISKDVPRLNYSKTHDNEQNQSKLHDKSWTWTLLHQQTVEDIQRIPNTYYTLHFDETTNAQSKKQMDILVRYYSEVHGEVKVRFLKAVMFGHAFAKTVADEVWRTHQQSGLSSRFLLSLSSDGPNVNKSIKQSINNKLEDRYTPKIVFVQFIISCYSIDI